MQPNGYFDFLTPEDIRIKGTRVGIETILYYLQYQQEVMKYMQSWLNYCNNSAQQQDENPSPAILNFILVTNNRSSMPIHLADHLA